MGLELHKVADKAVVSSRLVRPAITLPFVGTAIKAMFRLNMKKAAVKGERGEGRCGDAICASAVETIEEDRQCLESVRLGVADMILTSSGKSGSGN